MAITLAFDVYGTLIDTHGVILQLEKQLGDRAGAFSQLWRDKQLEYSFRRGLMQNYQNFNSCTRQALDYADNAFGNPLGEQTKTDLLDAYRSLPAFADVKPGLQHAQSSGFRVFAFSNGIADVLESLLTNAGIREYFQDIVSVDEIKSFKPNPAVYCHFLRRAGVTGNQAWLISSNPFDVIGARSAGMQAAWIQRTPDALFDPWEIEPTITLPDLTLLADRISAADV